jgi:hypothetical protein
MGKCCCGGGCNGACLAVEPNTNSCDPTLPTSAYINSLPAFITVEIDLTWDGTPYTFSFVMKKFTLICPYSESSDYLFPLCMYKMYCGDVAACDAWPHTIAGQVLLGDKGGCTTVDCDYSCSPNYSYNPTNEPSDYQTIITCGVQNLGAPETDESCPCVYPDAGCSWVGYFNIRMISANNCDNQRFLDPGTLSIAKDTGFSFNPSGHYREYAFDCKTIDGICIDWTYSSITNDYCAPAFLIDNTYVLPQCGGSPWADHQYGGYINYNFGGSGCIATCYSPLVGSYPLTKISLQTPPQPPFYNGVFDAFSNVNFAGNLSTVTYRPCCGVVTPTGGHAIAWEVTRFEVV